MARKFLKRKYKRRPKKVIRRKRSGGLKKTIRSVIRSTAEKKAAFTNMSITGFNSGVNSGADVVPILPNINVGTGDNARIGDEIRCTQLTVQGYFQYKQLMNDTNTTANRRIAVRVFWVAPKRYPSQADAITNYYVWLPTLLKKGGSAVGFTGVISDLWAPINTDTITSFGSKVYYINMPAIWSNGTAGVGQVAAIDMGSTVKFFKKTFKMKSKKLFYDVNVDSGLCPVNFNPIMLLGYVFMDGSTPDTTTQTVTATFDTNMKYIDV